MLRQDTVARGNNLKRKHLLYSLITGLVIGIVAGTPIGWFAHQFYYQQRLAQTLLCREENRNQPLAVVEARCGRPY